MWLCFSLSMMYDDDMMIDKLMYYIKYLEPWIAKEVKNYPLPATGGYVGSFTNLLIINILI